MLLFLGVDRGRVNLKRPKTQENPELGQDLSCLWKQHLWQGSCKLGVGLCHWDACRPSPHSPEAGVLNQQPLLDHRPLFFLWSRKERAAAKTKTTPRQGSSFPSCYHLTERGGRNGAPLAETKWPSQPERLCATSVRYGLSSPIALLYLSMPADPWTSFAVYYAVTRNPSNR